jgi:shikimate dehydrogenase
MPRCQFCNATRGNDLDDWIWHLLNHSVHNGPMSLTLAPADHPLVPPASTQAPSAPAPAKLLVGLIGAGIQRSLTPAMHEAEAAAQGLRLHYQLIDLDCHSDLSGTLPEALPALVRAARWMGFAGLNITFPCKQAVIAELDELSAEAGVIGAVNTVVFRDGRAVGHNTDVSGWRWAFQRDLPGADLSRVVLLGAGGAGRAVAQALVGLSVADLIVVDTDLDRAQALAEDLQARHPRRRVRAAMLRELPTLLPRCTGLVHATPTGMDKLPGLPLDAALLHPALWVSEIVYFPLETALLRAARAAGCRVSNGSAMATGQAMDAFALFTGREPDRHRMSAHLQGLLALRMNEERDS